MSWHKITVKLKRLAYKFWPKAQADITSYGKCLHQKQRKQGNSEKA